MTFSGLTPHRFARVGGVKQAVMSAFPTAWLPFRGLVALLALLRYADDLPNQLPFSEILR